MAIINGDDSNNPILSGTYENDVIDGKKGNDGLSGFTGNDKLYGGEGNDTLDGSFGSDTMWGGAGNDTYYVDNVNDKVIEYSNQGVDTVISSINYTLGGVLNNLTLIGDATFVDGTGNPLDNKIVGNDFYNRLYGEGGNDKLDGGAGDDTLDGGTGNDSMWGGAGDDTYYVDNVNDKVIEYSNQGIDTVISSIDYKLGGVLNDLTLTGNAIKGTGNSLENSIAGNNADNQLYGGDGADDLYGDSGKDKLYGGAGDDNLSGGTGYDTLIGDSGKDYLDGFSSGKEYDILTGGTQADTFALGSLFSSSPYYLGDGYATITDFNRVQGDKIQLLDLESNNNQYSLESGNWTGSNALDTGIYYKGDFIGVVQDTTNVSFPQDFTFVEYTPIG